MQKLILDTNVVISSLIQKNFPYLILEYCFDGKAIICLSNPILQEYFEVVRRPKFARFPDFLSNAEFLLTRLQEYSEFYDPSDKIDLIADEPDNRLLELARQSKANFIVTGNTNDFKMSSFETTKIVSPREFWTEHKK
ncbi:MAG: putative toxin-antitoxin system toxin component, PIN family [Bacteroidia bacterium]